jgi:hypothetical protein
MPAGEIPASQWPIFLGDFGFRHFGWKVTVVERAPGRSKHLLNSQSFLEEVATSNTDGKRKITIVAGTPFHPFHSVVGSDPLHVRVAAGAQPALEIESADGSTVVMHLRRQDGCA